MDFNKYNKYIGWALFIVAAFVYLATMERSVSLWDCGEYIATSNKLEVGHPPGAPLFMMLNRLVSAFVSPENVALVINAVSALCSAFTILFLFWTITFIGKKLALSSMSYSSEGTELDDNQKMAAQQTGLFGRLFGKTINVMKTGKRVEKTELEDGQKWAVLFSGVVGALVYTFTDSFWFSAVEAEVYAMSSFFTALVFWAIYKWETAVDEAEGEEGSGQNPDYWLIFIMFMIGLSIGVHLLNLLAFPAIAYVYYFKKFKETTFKGFAITGAVALAGLLIIQNIIIPKTVSWASVMERYFANDVGLGENGGTMIFAILLIGLIVGGIWYSRKRGWVNVNTGMWGFAVLMIGYSCFAMIPIRSNANPPIDENNPENLVMLNSYLLREQYGDWPIFFGQQFPSMPDYEALNREEWGDRSDVYEYLFVVTKDDEDLAGFRDEKKAKEYIANNEVGNAEIVQKYYKTQDRSNSKAEYQDGHTVFFPRMYSPDSKHVRGYKDWSGYPDNPGMEPDREGTDARTVQGQMTQIYMPTVGENMRYFFNYQVNHMFWRYFMWNFSGRQNDDHNQNGDVTVGNWQTGINFIDKERLGDQSTLPEHRAANYGNNKYYLLPLILGLLGMFYHLFRHWKDWFIVLLLFVFTGFLIIVYLNQKPFEPRERDYAYAAAFYTFSIWIGLGVYAIWDLARSVNWKELGLIFAWPIGAGVFFYLIENVNDANHAMSYSVIYMGLVGAALIALFMAAKNFLKGGKQQAIAVGALTLLIPLQMGFQNWDDHDRSGRYTPREMAKNYLKPCDNQAIIFTNGDNDTFPLWYIQEVEEFRTDIRTVNLSLANTDWYIDQLVRRAYKSDPLKISFEEYEYRNGQIMDRIYTYSYFMGEFKKQLKGMSQNIAMKAQQDKKGIPDILKKSQDPQPSGIMIQFAKFNPETVNRLIEEVWRDAQQQFGFPAQARGLFLKKIVGERMYAEVLKNKDRGDIKPTLQEVMGWVKEGRFRLGDGKTSYIPYKTITIPVDKNKIKENQIVPERRYNEIADQIEFQLSKKELYKADILILDLIANSNWDRPIYFAATAGKSTYLGLQDYFQMEGLVYRLVPVRSNNPYAEFQIFGSVHAEKMYHIAVGDKAYDGPGKDMEPWDWGNLKGDNINVDYYNRRPVGNFRLQYVILALELVKLEEFEKAKNALDKSLEEFPDNKIPYANVSTKYVDAYLKAAAGLERNGEDKLAKEARETARSIGDRLVSYYKADSDHFGKFRWDLLASHRSQDDVAYQFYQNFRGYDELIRFTAVDSTWSKELVALREQAKQDFLQANENAFKDILDRYEDEDRLDAVQEMTNIVYFDLVQRFISEDVSPEAEMKFREMQFERDPNRQNQLNQELEKIIGATKGTVGNYPTLVGQYKFMATVWANSSNRELKDRGDRLTGLMYLANLGK